MKKSKFSDSQILSILKHHEAGVPVAELSREHGISIRLACVTFGVSQTCYRYEATQSGENQHIANWRLRCF